MSPRHCQKGRTVSSWKLPRPATSSCRVASTKPQALATSTRSHCLPVIRLRAVLAVTQGVQVSSLMPCSRVSIGLCRRRLWHRQCCPAPSGAAQRRRYRRTPAPEGASRQHRNRRSYRPAPSLAPASGVLQDSKDSVIAATLRPTEVVRQDCLRKHMSFGFPHAGQSQPPTQSPGTYLDGTC